MPRHLLSISLGALALVTTTAVLCTQIVLSLHIDHDSPGRPASILSAVFESAVLALLAWLFAATFLPTIREQSERCRVVIFGLGITACTLATITSIVALVYLSKSDRNAQNSIVIGSSTALGLSLPSQLIFMAVHFLSARMDFAGAAWSLHKDEEAGRSRKINLKAVRYSQTLPTMNYSCDRDTTKVELRGRSNSTGGKSAAETFRSSMTSVSQLVRPISSRSRLMPSKEKSRSASIDSIANRSSGDDTFDSWDTSAVDMHNRQAVLEISSPTQAKTRGLETIPASPMVSRSPSPDSLYDLEPPHLQGRDRSRSFSPVSLRRELRDLPSPTFSTSEAHIHPLFRSDSPDPHPLATPGTSVVAAPEAARVIVHRASNRSLNRIRSDSLPVAPSPLSRQGSTEDIRSLKIQRSELEPITGSKVEEPGSQTNAERKMTPPVPDWLLSGRPGTR